MSRRFAPILAILILFPAALSAQVIRGRLVPAPGEPAGGAVVILLDANGAERGRAVSGPTGNYGLVAPGAGSYRLKVLRVGFNPWTSDLLVLAANQVVEFSPALPTLRVVVAAIEVTSDTRCSAGTDVAGAAATLLDEGRKAVLSADVALHGPAFRFLVRQYRRREDANGVVTEADTTAPEVSNGWPVESAPVSELRQNGFVTDAGEGLPGTYYGPDAQVLFSDFFLHGHCFTVGRPDASDSGLVPLKFRTARGRNRPDIEGALWMDRATLGLRRLDFRYVGLPGWTSDADAGGRLEFLRLPSGLWIIRKWELRAPIANQPRNSINFRYGGLATIGGEIIEVRSAAGEVIYASDSSAVGALRH